MATITYTVTACDTDLSLLVGASVKIFDLSEAVIASGLTNASGVFTGTVSSSDVTPATWRVVIRATGYFKAAGFMIFTDATTCSQYIYLEEDRDLISLTSTLARLNASSVAAAGSAQGSAALLAEGGNAVTASDGTKGVILPVAVAGALVLVANTVSAQNLKVYPASGATINYGSADAAVTVAGQKQILFWAQSATQWYSILTA